MTNYDVYTRDDLIAEIEALKAKGMREIMDAAEEMVATEKEEYRNTINKMEKNCLKFMRDECNDKILSILQKYDEYESNIRRGFGLFDSDIRESYIKLKLFIDKINSNYYSPPQFHESACDAYREISAKRLSVIDKFFSFMVKMKLTKGDE